MKSPKMSKTWKPKHLLIFFYSELNFIIYHLIFFHTNMYVAVNHDVFFRMISNNRALMSVIKFEMYNEHYYDNNWKVVGTIR